MAEELLSSRVRALEEKQQIVKELTALFLAQQDPILGAQQPKLVVTEATDSAVTSGTRPEDPLLNEHPVASTAEPMYRRRPLELFQKVRKSTTNNSLSLFLSLSISISLSLSLSHVMVKPYIPLIKAAVCSGGEGDRGRKGPLGPRR